MRPGTPVIFTKSLMDAAARATLVTTNIDFKDLGDYLGDPVTTTALVDRMIHHIQYLLPIQGPSWRMHESRKLNAKAKRTENTKNLPIENQTA